MNGLRCLTLLVYVQIMTCLFRKVFGISYINVDNVNESVTPLSTEFATIVDSDSSTFLIRRLTSDSTRSARSCYEMKKLKESVKFCYPNLHIAGIGKSGTSALYEFFTEHATQIKRAHGEKEYCVHTLYFNYLKEFAPLYNVKRGEPQYAYVNGCINTGQVTNLHRILSPKAAYVMIVRDLPERTWAAHNFFCYAATGDICSATGVGWTRVGNYRDPLLFDQMLSAANDERQESEGINSRMRNTMFSCANLNSLYRDRMSTMARAATPLVVSIEGLSSREPQHYGTQLSRMEALIGQQLGLSVKLDEAHLHRVNSGNNRGAANIESNAPSQKPPEGVYSISNNQPMLQSSYEFIMNCWSDCQYISDLSQYQYNCTQRKSS